MEVSDLLLDTVQDRILDIPLLLLGVKVPDKVAGARQQFVIKFLSVQLLTR